MILKICSIPPSIRRNIKIRENSAFVIHCAIVFLIVPREYFRSLRLEELPLANDNRSGHIDDSIVVQTIVSINLQLSEHVFFYIETASNANLQTGVQRKRFEHHLLHRFKVDRGSCFGVEFKTSDFCDELLIVVVVVICSAVEMAV